MTKIFKKVLTVMVGISLLATMAACKNDGQKPTDSNAATTATVKVEAKKAKIVMINPGDFYANDSDNQIVLDEIKKRFKADTNIDLEIEAIDLPWNGFEDKVKLKLGSGEQIDSVPIWADAAKSLISNGLIQPMDELIEKYGQNIKKIVPKDAWKFVYTGGKIYGLPRVASDRNISPMWIRSDWLEKYNLKMPETPDDLLKVLKVFKEKDPAGNGNTVPILATLMNETFGTNFNGVCLGLFSVENFIDKDGSLKPKFLNPNFKHAVEYAREIYTQGLTTKDYFSMKKGDDKNKVKQGVVGVFSSKLGGLIDGNDAYIPNMQKVTPSAKVEWLTIKNIEGKLSYGSADLSSDFILIPANSKNAEVVMKYYDWMCSSKDNFNLVNYGIENKHWRKKGDMIEILSEGGANQTENKVYSGFYSGMFDMFGLPGYGRALEANYIIYTYSDPVKQKFHETERLPRLKQIIAADLRKSINYGFTATREGIAQETYNNRLNMVITAISKYIAGTTNYDEVQKAIDAYAKNPGGPEEIKQLDEQYKAWSKLTIK